MAITKTTLEHLTTRAKLHGAMLRAKTKSLLTGTASVQTILNGKGKPFLNVVHNRGVKGGFYFHCAKTGECVTNNVLNALRA